MATVTSRDELKDYCLRRLGAPVIKINVDDDQLEDRIDDAIQFYQDYHFDATELFYWKHTITQQDVTQGYFDIDPSILGITRIFPLNDTLTKSNMFDLRYQLRLHELYDFTSTSYSNFAITMQHLTNLSEMFTGEVPIRFQRHTHRLYPDWAWGSEQCPVGSTVIAEGYMAIDPETYDSVYNDRWLKEYVTSLFKRQWGENMKKFGNIQLPGGLTLNGKETFDEAMSEISRLETEMQDRYELPVQFMIG
jgi:hypothetical protein